MMQPQDTDAAQASEAKAKEQKAFHPSKAAKPLAIAPPPRGAVRELLLESSTVNDILQTRGSRPLITVATTTTLSDVVGFFCKHRILSVPVLSDDGVVQAALDYGDLLTFLMLNLPDVATWKVKGDKWSLEELQLRGRAFKDIQAGDVVAFCNSLHAMPLQALWTHSPASTVATMLSAPGVHRACVFNEDGVLTSLVSQTDLARWLTQQLRRQNQRSELKQAALKTFKELGFTQKGFEVFTVTTDTPLWHALLKLTARGVGGLAVVDPESGRLRGNFSASDCSQLFEHALPTVFNLPVGEFLLKFSPDSLKPCVEKGDRPWTHVVEEMLGDHHHRVWTVDDGFRPTGVITLTDVARMALAT